MAIIIQENPNKKALISLIVGIVVLAGGAFLTYYLFFSPAPLAEDFVRPDGYERASLFAQANLEVESVINSPVWGFLQKDSLVPSLVTEIIAPRINIFQSFRRR